MQLEADQFLDLVHFYRLELVDPEKREEANQTLVGVLSTSSDEPLPSHGIKAPSWWRGGTTLSEASFAADQMRNPS